MHRSDASDTSVADAPASSARSGPSGTSARARRARSRLRAARSRAGRAAATAVVALGLTAGSFVALPDGAEAAAPTWEQVLAARGSEQTKRTALADIETAVADATARAASAQAAADEAGRVLSDARLAVDDATAAHERAQTKADEARASADSAQAVVGQAAAMLARPNSSGLTGDLLRSGAGAEEVLRGLSMSAKVGENLAALRDRASTADKLATSLADQAGVALAARDRLAADATAALEAAAAASAAAQRDAEATESEKATLAAQLALLQDDRLTLEQAYAKAQADAAAAAAAARRPTPPTGTGSGTGPVTTAPGVSGPGTTQPDPGTGWVAAIRSFSSYQAYGYRVHPITGDYRLHAGADFGASCGTPIYSVAAGTVSYAGPSSGYGNLVVVEHGGGVSSAYAHMERSGIYVGVGQSVGAGQAIAAVGTSGGSTGCHLHLEVRRGGVPTDPVAFLATKGVR